jgi:hypothetical protein
MSLAFAKLHTKAQLPCAAHCRVFSHRGASAVSKNAFLLALLGAALVCLLPAAPAQAQAFRTFVSAAGNDGNNCTDVSTPCRHLAQAYAATSAGGEIDVLDPANYGGLTISQAVNIEGFGWATLSAGSGLAAITITAGASDKINIRGVVLDGLGISTNTGISFTSGGSLNVQDSVIRNFSNYGIFFGPSASTQSQISMSNTLVSDNLNGVAISSGGSGALIGVLDHVRIENSTQTGLQVGSISTGTVNVTVSDSVSANNGFDGISSTSSGAATNVMVRNSTIVNNGYNSGASNFDNGLYATGSGAQIWVTRSALTGNANGWRAASSGVVTSYNDNNIDGNTSANTAPPQIGYR